MSNNLVSQNLQNFKWDRDWRFQGYAKNEVMNLAIQPNQKLKILDFSNYHDSDAKDKTLSLWIESSSTSSKLSIEHLMEKTKPGVA